MMKNQNFVGLIAKNSLNYVECLYECYGAEEVVVALKSKDQTIDSNLVRIIHPVEKFGWMQESLSIKDSNAPCQISFTSGTEGAPKAVVLTHAILNDVSRRLIDVMEMDASVKEYLGAPVNYSFGLGRCRAVFSLGGSVYLPENGFDPYEIKEMLANGQINSVSAVPSHWRMLLNTRSIFRGCADKLKWIEVGSQYLSSSEKYALKELFPNAIICQHYGLTEASRTTFLRIDLCNADAMESVGSTIGDGQIAIAQDGRIKIRGPHVATHLLKDDQLVSQVDDEGWFATSDLGRIENGLLFYDGRADEVINCGGVKITPDALEAEIRKRLAGAKFSITKVPHPILGDAVLVAYVNAFDTAGEAKFKEVVYAAALELQIGVKAALNFMSIDSMPLTENGKVKRKDLVAIWHLMHESKHENKETPVPKHLEVSSSSVNSGLLSEQYILQLWSDALGSKLEDPEANFYDLGGDSLSALTTVIELERKNVDSRISKGLMQGKSARQLADEIAASDEGLAKSKDIESETVGVARSIGAARGLLALLVVFAHWSGGVFERIPEQFNILTKILAPLFSFGTPGFSVVYGIGIGYSMLGIFKNDRSRFYFMNRRVIVMVTLGVLLIGAVNHLSLLHAEASPGPRNPFDPFYSVLTFYVLVSLVLGGILSILLRFRSPSIAALLFGLISYCIHYWVFAPLGAVTLSGLSEFIKLLFAAKYAFFNMLTGALWGIGLGIWMKASKSNGLLEDMLLLGAGLVLLGALISSHMGVSVTWFVWPVATNLLHRWFLYTGLVIIVICLVWGASRVNIPWVNGRRLIDFLGVLGVLAFPIFVLHEMVLPLKNIMNIGFDLSSTLSISIALLAFFVPISLLFRRVQKVYAR